MFFFEFLETLVMGLNLAQHEGLFTSGGTFNHKNNSFENLVNLMRYSLFLVNPELLLRKDSRAAKFAFLWLYI
jgi:hypothetical protein